MHRNDGRPEHFSIETYTMLESSVKEKSVNNEQMTGGTETCILFDGTVRTPVAEIEIETPYYSGKVKSVCMENPLYDVIKYWKCTWYE